MLQVLHPAALWTLAALALPLALHLWRQPPRTVRLGSLRFLELAPRRVLRNLRWRELLLFCVRLGLLAALALLLAEPHWLTAPGAGPRRWALLDPTAAPSGDSLVHWHAAQSAGYELRRLAAGFPAASADFPASADAGARSAPDLWSLLREADAQLPPGSTLAVFSPVRLAALRGVRPAFAHSQIEWFRTPDAAGEDAHEWVVPVPGLRARTGRSDARSTVFTPGPADDPAADRPAPPATSILILHDAEHDPDSRYAEAAVRAAADSAGQRVNLQDREITPDVDNAAVTDWTFWLSTRPVPAALAARAPRLVQYGGGDPVSAGGWIVAPSEDAVDGTRVWQRALASTPAGVPRWSDGQGNPILSYTHPPTGERWELLTRFDAAWTDLPRTAALPAWMRALLFPGAAQASDAGPVHDRRSADPSQCYPADSSTVAAIPVLASADQPAKDLRWPLWTLAALLFAVERALTLRRRAAPSVVSHVRPEPFATASR